MPNWCEQEVYIHGETSMVQKLYDALTGDQPKFCSVVLPEPDNMFRGLLGDEERKMCKREGRPNWYDWQPEGFDQKFEYWCAEQVENMLHKRDMKKAFKKYKIVRRKCDKEGKVYMFNHPHDHKSTAITYRWPDAVILNDLPEAEALDHWKRPVGGDV